MEKNHLYVLWTNADKVTAKLMVFMYTINSMKRGWWEKVTLVIWGAPTKLAATDPEIQAKIKEAQDEGVEVEACIACARELGVIEELEKQDIKVVSWGPLLTDVLKKEDALITI